MLKALLNMFEKGYEIVLRYCIFQDFFRTFYFYIFWIFLHFPTFELQFKRSIQK